MPASDPVAEHLAELRLRNLAATSIAQRRYALGRLARYLECEPGDLLAATADDLDRWQRSMARLGPRHRSTSATHVRQFFKWAMRHELVRLDPTLVLLEIRLPRSMPHPIGEDDLSMALACAPDRIRPWLVLAAYAGMRAGEIAGLMREHVRDTASPPVLAFTGKGGRDRVVPMSELVLMELRVAGLPSRGFVFPRGDGQPGQNRPGQVSSLCNRYLHDLGIVESLHSLRHRFATSGYAVSQDLRAIQELMGHSSPATTSGYVQWSNAAAVSIVEAIAAPTRRPDVNSGVSP